MNYDKNKFKDVRELDEHTAVGYLKVSEAVISKNNVREQNSKVDALTDVTLKPSIEAFGMANLPLCTPNGEIVCGSRRLRAFKNEEWMPVLIRDNLSNSEQLEISLHENWARTNLPIEDEIESLQKYIKENPSLTKPEVAKRLQVPLTWVTDRLQIAKNIIPLLNGQKIARSEGLNKGQEKMRLTPSKAGILARDWISKTVREDCIEKIQKEGMGNDELHRVIGKWKVLQTIIEEEENPEIKAKLESEYSKIFVFEANPEDVLERQRDLRGYAPNLEKVTLPIESFEKTNLKGQVTIPPEINKEIVKFFLDRTGRYVRTSILVEGELPLCEIKKLKAKNP
jgi:ParB-like chromosome segregation protein Spo0J